MADMIMKKTATGLPGISAVSASFQSNATFMKRIGTPLLFGTMLVYASGAQALVIDSFEDLLNQGVISQSTPDTPTASSTSSGLTGVAGGQRNVATSISNTGSGSSPSLTARADNGRFRVSQQSCPTGDPVTDGFTELRFAGENDDGLGGPGGLDLTCEDELDDPDQLCENDELVIEGIEVVDGVADITVTVTDGDGNVGDVTLALVDGELVFDFADFANVDFTDVEEITVEIAGTDEFDVAIDEIVTAPSGDGPISNIAQSGSSPSQIPEPGTLSLLASALIGFAAIRRRRR